MKRTSAFCLGAVSLVGAVLLSVSLVVAASPGADVDRGPVWRPSAPLVEEVGAVGLYQTLLRLPVVARFASIGAHPDDDDSAALAYISRGLHARTANVVANRGEGGQNAIGAELYQALGVIRTEELLAARRLDGAEQYFLQTYDFGFSKSREETLERWGQEAVICDLVRFIRTFRPDVILNHHWAEAETFTGHGHHQALGAVLPIAIERAADPNACPDQIEQGLVPWETPRVFGRGGKPGPVTVTLEVGTYDPVLGRSYAELGAESRSYHRTQTMGQLQARGSARTTWTLLVNKAGPFDPSEGIFSGMDTSLSGIARLAGEEEDRVPLLRTRLMDVEHRIRRIIAAYNPLMPESIVSDLVAVLAELRDIRGYVQSSGLSPIRKSYIDDRLEQKIQETEVAIVKATGLELEVFTPQETYVPGEQLKATITVYNRSRVPVQVVSVGLSASTGGVGRTDVVNQTLGTSLKYNEKASVSLSMEVPQSTPTSRIFWRIEEGPPGSQGRVIVGPNDTELALMPFRPYPIIGYADVVVAGQVVRLARRAQYRFLDRVTGEVRYPTAVVEPISVELDPAMRVLRRADTEQVLEYVVRVTNNGPAEATVHVGLDASEGLRVEPELVNLQLGPKGASDTATFRVTVPPGLPDGTYRVRAIARVGDRTYTEGYHAVKYPHIEPHYFYQPAQASIVLFTVEVARDIRVGYVMGPGDKIPEALAQIGVEVTLLDPQTLDTGGLSQFDTIITGPLAYEFRPDLVANNNRLLEWVKDGGVLIVQYNRYPWNQLNVAPYPSRINEPHDRVTREDAPVHILVPDHPIFQYPNRIDERDFEGWQQERGLYFMGEWDERYVPLLASNDPGEEPKKGGMLFARYGKGAWIYTGYAFFRQLPGGVPGAFRLFANMISLPAYLER